jgi:D-methionine transport system ATP-binding protein
MARLKPTIAFETGAAIAAGGGVDEAHAPRAETVLRLVDIAKRFGALSAIDGVSLEVKRGEVLGIIGRSGAGKSTLIRCLNGLEKPDRGRVEVLGQDIIPLGERELRKVRARIGMIFQHFNLLSSKTVADNIALPLKIGRVIRKFGVESDAKKIEERVHQLLDIVKLPRDFAKRRPRQLSGGQKQRVGIARALAAEPVLLLCDEATSALDPETTASILALLSEINRKLDLTIILITHEMSVIRAIADRVIVLDYGRVVEEGDAAAVFANPRAALTRRLLLSSYHDGPTSVAASDGIPGVAADWAPGFETVFRVTLEGELVDRPVLADLTTATGARPVILQAGTLRGSGNVAATIRFSVRCPAPDLVSRIERYLTRVGAKVEILGHAQSAS